MLGSRFNWRSQVIWDSQIGQGDRFGPGGLGRTEGGRTYESIKLDGGFELDRGAG